VREKGKGKGPCAEASKGGKEREEREERKKKWKEREGKMYINKISLVFRKRINTVQLENLRPLVPSAPTPQTPKEDIPATTTGNSLDRKGPQVRRPSLVERCAGWGEDIAPRFPVFQSSVGAAAVPVCPLATCGV
jgi:hypothetical protein